MGGGGEGQEEEVRSKVPRHKAELEAQVVLVVGMLSEAPAIVVRAMTGILGPVQEGGQGGPEE